MGSGRIGTPSSTITRKMLRKQSEQASQELTERDINRLALSALTRKRHRDEKRQRRRGETPDPYIYKCGQWTYEQEQRLRQLRKQGVSKRRIAEKMVRPTREVIDYCRKLEACGEL